MSSVAKGDRSYSHGPRAVVLRPRRLFFSLFQTRGRYTVLVPAVLPVCSRSRTIEVVRTRTNIHALGPFGLSIVEMLMA